MLPPVTPSVETSASPGPFTTQPIIETSIGVMISSRRCSNVPDVVFAEKIVGDGIAIKPTGNKMVAPVDGTIGKIFETNHAFSIESDSGVELFVHFGIDTVELKGH